MVPSSMATPLSTTPTPYWLDPAGTSTHSAPLLVSSGPSVPYATHPSAPDSNVPSPIGEAALTGPTVPSVRAAVANAAAVAAPHLRPADRRCAFGAVREATSSPSVGWPTAL
ncbi:hypothetical protein ACVW07_003895 [Cellulomonas sp. URHB0016]